MNCKVTISSMVDKDGNDNGVLRITPSTDSDSEQLENWDRLFSMGKSRLQIFLPHEEVIREHRFNAEMFPDPDDSTDIELSFGK